MDRDGLQDYLERLLDALIGIRDELSRLDTPTPVTPVVPEPDPWPAIAAIVIGAVVLVVVVAALVVAWRALAVLSALREERVQSARRRDRGEFGASVRRYSELLGVEAVTGRQAARGDTAASMRSALEHRLGHDREPGALELLEEVAGSRAGLADLPTSARTAANGLAAMTAEWSIDRWEADPEAWLRDHRERHRLRTLATRPAPPEAEPVDSDTRLS
jgi:hypothetical protein